MSLILEALRKSEAERRRGHAPDLLSETVPVAPATRATAVRPWPWLFAATAAVIATVLVLLWWPRSAATPAAADVAAVAAAPVGDSPPREVTGVTGTTVTAAVSPPAATVRPSFGKAGIDAASTRPPSTPTNAPAALAVTHPQPAVAVPAPPREPPAQPAADVAPPSIARVEIPVAIAFTSADVPLRLSDLTGEERQQLPTLKVSMHMWAPAAGNRFAIIDGTRVGEGDRVGEATIEAIQEDGVMLAWRGRHIRLPIR